MFVPTFCYLPEACSRNVKIGMNGELMGIYTRTHVRVEAPDSMKKRRHMKACKSTGVDTT